MTLSTFVKRAFGLAAVLLGLAVLMLNASPRSTTTTTRPRPNAEVLTTARAAVDSMTRDGAIVDRSCNPNETSIKLRAWISLPERYRKTATRSLALLCEQDGHERAMTIYSERGVWLAHYAADDTFDALSTR